MTIVGENVLELKRKEEDQQEAMDCYSNYESLTPSSSSTSSTSVSYSSRKKARVGASEGTTASTRLRQDEEDDLRSGDVTEDDHGKKFISDDDEFFDAPSSDQEKTKTKAATAMAMMEAQREIPNEEEAYDEYACYDGSTATMESCDDETCEERMSGHEDEATYEDEPTYEEEFTNYTYERAGSYSY
jgi:E3 ubiquitin-protein ligase DOA10